MILINILRSSHYRQLAVMTRAKTHSNYLKRVRNYIVATRAIRAFGGSTAKIDTHQSIKTRGKCLFRSQDAMFVNNLCEAHANLYYTWKSNMASRMTLALEMSLILSCNTLPL